jgi:hypothetical protein
MRPHSTKMLGIAELVLSPATALLYYLDSEEASEYAQDGVPSAGRDLLGSRAPLSVLHGFGDVLEALVGVGEEHHGPVLVVEELVVHAGEAGA